MMDNILNYPIIPLDIYKRYKDAKKFRVNNTNSFWNILGCIVDDCNSKRKNNSRLAQLIVFDLKMLINHPSVFKENSSAKVLERRMSFLCNGQTGDDIFKQNPDIRSLLSSEVIKTIPNDIFSILKSSITSNYREKGDIILFDSELVMPYKISIKSLIPDNKEVNFGSCSFPSLFLGIDEDLQALGERKAKLIKTIGDKEYSIGRGSKEQLLNLLKYLEDAKLLEKFLERFEIVFRGVFKEDVLFYIKDHDYLDIYLMSNSEFVDCVLDSVKQKRENKKDFVITRWEGNSIRLERDILLSKCTRHIKKPFSHLIDESSLIGILTGIESQKAKTLLEK